MKTRTNKLPNVFSEFCILFISPYKKYFFRLVFFSVLIGCYGTIGSYLTKILIDILIEADFELYNCIFLSCLFVFNFIVHSFSWRGIDAINLSIAPNLRSEIIAQIFTYIIQHSYKFFQSNLSGAISNNILILAENIEQLSIKTSPFIIRSIVQLFLALISMYFIHPLFTLVLVVWVISFMYLSFVNADQIKCLSDKFSKNYSNISGAIIDTISNIQSTKIFGHEELEHSYLQNILVNFKKDFVAKELFLLKFWIKQSISIILLVLVVLLSLVYLRSQNLITVGEFAFILGLVLCVCENIWEFTQQFGQVNDMIGKCRQSLKSLVITDFEENYITTTNLPSNCPEIEFQNVTFYHEPESIPLKIDNLKINPYEKIGIVGYSGSGKSTFVNLILRLFQTDSGRVLIGYKNINNISKNSLRSIISAIPQNPILFHRTIADNISYGNPNATDNDILQAAIKAGAHEFITSLPKGYNTMVGEMGLKLSGGQRQRIAMARLILKQPQILILDEATSQLDSFTETIIQESLKKIMSGKTSIVITHRLSTITNMDRILVFDKGKIVGDGTHSTLLANNSIYKKLWRNSIK